jgi:hypothetical protein
VDPEAPAGELFIFFGKDGADLRLLLRTAPLPVMLSTVFRQTLILFLNYFFFQFDLALPGPFSYFS